MALAWFGWSRSGRQRIQIKCIPGNFDGPSAEAEEEEPSIIRINMNGGKRRLEKWTAAASGSVEEDIKVDRLFIVSR